MNFRSDNESPAAPEILAAIQEANSGHAYAYGEDGVTSGMRERFRQTFEIDLEVLPVATGTAANALSIAQLTPAYGSVFCHREAHLYADECGAPEFYSGGAKVIPLSGELAKISPRTLRNAVARMEEMGVHESQPSAVSLSQATELGTVYKPDEIREISRIASGRGLGLHMDGARLANAVRTIGLHSRRADLESRSRHPLLWGDQERSHGCRGGGGLQQRPSRGPGPPPQARRASFQQDAFHFSSTGSLSQG